MVDFATMVQREDGDQRAVMSGLFRKILKTVWVLINIVVLIALALSAWDMHRNRRAAHFIAWFVAGVFVLLAVPITFYEVAQHLENYRMPRLQRHVIRILFMVPIYAVDCWLALRFKDGTIYFDTIRECYEAYVIYNFYTYCTVYLQEFCNPGLEQIIARKPPARHIWPISAFLDFPRMGEPFLRLCRHGVINYVVMRPLTTALAFVSEANGVYGDGQILNPLVAYPYLALLNNVSQAWAMYCLIIFYRATHEELAPIRPFYKFCTVKAVVFLSFWQGQTLLFMVKMQWIKVSQRETKTDYDAAEVATAMQEFLICVEMFFAAIAHSYAFPPSEYFGAQIPKERRMMDNIADMFDLRDVYHDVVNYGESNQARLSHRWASFVGLFTGKPPPPLASPSTKTGLSRTTGESEFARLVDNPAGRAMSDVEMSRIPGIGSAGDGRVYGERSGGGSRYDGSSGRRRERRASDGGEGASPRGPPGGGGVTQGKEMLFTLGGSSDEEEGVAMAPVSRESARFSKFRS